MAASCCDGRTPSLCLGCGHALVVLPPYAVALAIIFLALSVRVIVARRTGKIGFGTGGSDDLERWVRSQANFAEYVPLALILLSMAELDGSPRLWLHVCCSSLLIGRLAHAIGFARPATDNIARIVGMTGSQTAIVGAALLLIWRMFAAG